MSGEGVSSAWAGTDEVPADLNEWSVRVTAGGAEVAYGDSLMHIANGCLGLRVTVDHDDPHSDPGLYLTDCYDIGVGVARELVNLPHPLGIRVRAGLVALAPERPWRRTLHLRDGVVRAEGVLVGPTGERVALSTVTLVHATRPMLGLTLGTVAALGPGRPDTALELCWDGQTGNPYLGGAVPTLRQQHVVVDRVVDEGDRTEIRAHLAGSGEPLRLASVLSCAAAIDRFPVRERSRWGQGVVLRPAGPKPIQFSLLWTVGWDGGVGGSAQPDPMVDVDALLAEHRAEWRRRWEDYGVVLDGPAELQQALRFAVFNLLQSDLPARRRKITPARGLSSSYHSGATFFDTELHKDAYWAWTEPAVARSHLVQRYETLPAARAFAAATGYEGARFPEAANDLGGDNGPHDVLAYPEETRIVEWSVREVMHISADVAYAVRRYHQVTGDDDWVADHGVEIVLEAARFASSLLSWSDRHGAYVVRSVMGPDEYHYHVDNNQFTNTMLRWNLRYALAFVNGNAGWEAARRPAADDVGAVRRRIGLADAEVERWRSMADQVFLPPDLSGGAPAQHEGYEALPDCSPRAPATGPAARLTAAEADMSAALTAFDTKLIKQADVVLLAHLLPDALSFDATRRAYSYYEPRTAHESSLSAAPHGVVAARLGLLAEAEAFFRRAARYNLDYTPQADYRNGLHLSAYAGAWQILVEGLIGLRAAGADLIELDPRIPAGWHRVEIPLAFRGRRLRITVTPARTRIVLTVGSPLRLQIRGTTHTLTPGDEAVLPGPDDPKG